MEELTPITRREVFLAKASGQEVETPTPVTREEVFLDKIAKGGGSNKFIVTLTPTAADFSGTMDKTVAEINEAYEAGQEIVFNVLTSATSHMMIPVANVGYSDAFDYPSFNAYLFDDNTNVMLLAFTATTDDGTKQTYSTAIYALTPAS